MGAQIRLPRGPLPVHCADLMYGRSVALETGWDDSTDYQLKLFNSKRVPPTLYGRAERHKLRRNPSRGYPTAGKCKSIFLQWSVEVCRIRPSIVVVGRRSAWQSKIEIIRIRILGVDTTNDAMGATGRGKIIKQNCSSLHLSDSVGWSTI